MRTPWFYIFKRVSMDNLGRYQARLGIMDGLTYHLNNYKPFCNVASNSH